MNASASPIVVGALGGSGTRVVVRILRHAGVFMGSRLNDAEDSQPLMDFYDTWGRACLLAGGGFPEDQRDAARERFLASIEDHLVDRPSEATTWGVKVPRNILFLRLWLDVFPQLRFIQVIRDGLDMAFSGDSNQLRLFGDLVLSDEERRSPRRQQTISYWSKANLDANAFGRSTLGDRYLLVRFEDVCTDPLRSATEIFDFAGSSDRSCVPIAAAEVTPPSTIGRSRMHSARELAPIVRLGRPALEHFSYLDQGLPRRSWTGWLSGRLKRVRG